MSETVFGSCLKGGVYPIFCPFSLFPLLRESRSHRSHQRLNTRTAGHPFSTVNTPHNQKIRNYVPPASTGGFHLNSKSWSTSAAQSTEKPRGQGQVESPAQQSEVSTLVPVDARNIGGSARSRLPSLWGDDQSKKHIIHSTAVARSQRQTRKRRPPLTRKEKTAL